MMMTELSSQFYIQQFYQYAGWPKYNKHNNTYNACCPICREGGSWGKKKRLYYLVDKGVVCCHNCGWYGNALKWIIEASGKTYDELMEDADSIDITEISTHKVVEKTVAAELPLDSVDILNRRQILYYAKQPAYKDVMERAMQLIVNRRIHTAVNVPRSLYISVTDPVHKNRICIPFYDNGKVVHYQTRGIFSVDLNNRPKYLSRIGSEKTLFNIDQINTDIDTIYITEGPIDAMFIRNCVAVAGIQESSVTSYTTRQSNQLKIYPLHSRVWCLDSQQLDRASYIKTGKLLEAGERVMIWPDDVGKKYKDFNDMCVDQKIDEIPLEWIDENTYTSMRGKVRLSTIKPIYR